VHKLKAAHQKALQATLRVALCGTLAACGGGAKSKGSPPTTHPAPVSSPSSDATSIAPIKKTEPATEAECRSALAAAYPNGDAQWYDPNNHTPRTATPVSDSALAACCEHQVDVFSTSDYRKLGCCAAHFNGGHCTPWGPPMPPALVA
jgi:hypothetical protein